MDDPGKPLQVACTLTAQEIATRKAGLIPGLAAKALTCEARDNGYRLTFTASGNILSEIAAVVDAERQCCRFLQFDLTVTPGGGPVSLTLSGPAGTVEFLGALLTPDG
jgi:hypothetical protein